MCHQTALVMIFMGLRTLLHMPSVSSQSPPQIPPFGPSCYRQNDNALLVLLEWQPRCSGRQHSISWLTCHYCACLNTTLSFNLHIICTTPHSSIQLAHHAYADRQSDIWHVCVVVVCSCVRASQHVSGKVQKYRSEAERGHSNLRLHACGALSEKALHRSSCHHQRFAAVLPTDPIVLNQSTAPSMGAAQRTPWQLLRLQGAGMRAARAVRKLLTPSAVQEHPGQPQEGSVTR